MSREKRTKVLVFGLDEEKYQEWRSEVKSGLQGMDMAWQLSSCLCKSGEEAVEYAQQNPDLDIVYFVGRVSRSRSDHRGDAHVIARALSVHQNRPWVCLASTDLSYLINIIELQNVRVGCRMVEHEIDTRFSELSKAASV